MKYIYGYASGATALCMPWWFRNMDSSNCCSKQGVPVLEKSDVTRVDAAADAAAATAGNRFRIVYVVQQQSLLLLSRVVTSNPTCFNPSASACSFGVLWYIGCYNRKLQQPHFPHRRTNPQQSHQQTHCYGGKLCKGAQRN